MHEKNIVKGRNVTVQHQVVLLQRTRGSYMEPLQGINLRQGTEIIVIMCLLVLAIVLFRRRLQLLFGVVLRFLCGIVGIYLVNILMERVALDAAIGINPVTALVTTILGIPGVAALYGIKIISLL